MILSWSLCWKGVPWPFIAKTVNDPNSALVWVFLPLELKLYLAGGIFTVNFCYDSVPLERCFQYKICLHVVEPTHMEWNSTDHSMSEYN